MIVFATLLIPVSIVFEAALSFLGLGVQPPTADWGQMIAPSRSTSTALVVPAVPGPGVADYDLGLQHLRRRRARRPRPPLRELFLKEVRMGRFLIRRILRAFCVADGHSGFPDVLRRPRPVTSPTARRQAGDPADVAEVSPGSSQPAGLRPVRGFPQLLHHNLGYSYYHGEPVTRSQGGVPDHPLAGHGRRDHLAGARGSPASFPPCGAGHSGTGLHRWRCLLLDADVRARPVLFSCSTSSSPSMGSTCSPAQGYVLHRESGALVQGLVLPWSRWPWSGGDLHTADRGSLLEVMGEDYIRTARSKGLPERRVIYRHGLRSALTPVVSQFGIDLGRLLGGAIITENVFGCPASVRPRCTPSRPRTCR